MNEDNYIEKQEEKFYQLLKTVLPKINLERDTHSKFAYGDVLGTGTTTGDLFIFEGKIRDGHRSDEWETALLENMKKEHILANYPDKRHFYVCVYPEDQNMVFFDLDKIDWSKVERETKWCEKNTASKKCGNSQGKVPKDNWYIPIIDGNLIPYDC